MEIDQAALDFCEDVRTAMKRADLTVKYVALTIRTPQSKLSLQLNGHEPFTYFWRFTLLDVLFWKELTILRAQRVGSEVVTHEDLRAILAGLRRLTGSTSMLKAELSPVSDLSHVSDERKRA